MNSKCMLFILAAIVIICAFIMLGDDCANRTPYTLDSFTIVVTICMALGAGIFMPDLD
jgi:hypothetical protein